MLLIEDYFADIFNNTDEAGGVLKNATTEKSSIGFELENTDQSSTNTSKRLCF